MKITVILTGCESIESIQQIQKTAEDRDNVGSDDNGRRLHEEKIDGNDHFRQENPDGVVHHDPGHDAEVAGTERRQRRGQRENIWRAVNGYKLGGSWKGL